MNANTAMKEDYILKVGEEGASRLSLLNEVHGPYSHSFLRNTHTSNNMKILELGCGTGNMALWMASNIVPFGKVHAIDVNIDQIHVAQKLAKYHNVTNIEFSSISIYDLDKINEKFDLIYCRYLLMHLVDPIRALKNALNLLNPGGKIVCEEPTISTSFCYPYSSAYAKSRSLLKRLSEIKHLDFEIGMKLQEILISIDCEILDINFIQPILKNKNERKLLDMLFEECSDHYIHHLLSTDAEVKQIKMSLEKLSQDHKTLIGFPRTTQILAKKII
jgi:ubiquinone/menaquinone biosynthesis C-methylase UbiE